MENVSQIISYILVYSILPLNMIFWRKISKIGRISQKEVQSDLSSIFVIFCTFNNFKKLKMFFRVCSTFWYTVFILKIWLF